MLVRVKYTSTAEVPDPSSTPDASSSTVAPAVERRTVNFMATRQMNAKIKAALPHE
jgi:hypothetical protein